MLAARSCMSESEDGRKPRILGRAALPSSQMSQAAFENHSRPSFLLAWMFVTSHDCVITAGAEDVPCEGGAADLGELHVAFFLGSSCKQEPCVMEQQHFGGQCRESVRRLVVEIAGSQENMVKTQPWTRHSAFGCYILYCTRCPRSLC